VLVIQAINNEKLIMGDPLGVRIRQLANNKKLTIAKLERIAGLQNSTVRDIIIGKSKNPTVSTLTKICKALECSFYDLLNKEEVFQSNVLPIGTNVYSNMQWGHELFTKCAETIEKYLNKYELSFGLGKIIVLIIDLYLYSLTKNNNQLDEKSAEWLVEKLKVYIPIKSQVIENPLGIKIRQAAVNKNLPIAKLEKIAELQNGVVRDIIIGKAKNPTLNTLAKICNVLECSVYDLLDNEEIFQKYTLSARIESSIDTEWDYILFIKCVEIVGKYLDKHGSNFALSNTMSLIIDLYLHSLLKNNRQIMEDKSAEEFIKKLKVNLPIKLQD